MNSVPVLSALTMAMEQTRGSWSKRDIDGGGGAHNNLGRVQSAANDNGSMEVEAGQMTILA